MTRNDDFIGLLEGYLDEYEGSTPLPNQVRDATRAQLPSTQQRPARWPAWRFAGMNSFSKLAVAAAAVTVAGFLGFNYLVAPNIGGPDWGVPTPSPAPTSTPRVLRDGDLEAGTYAINPFPSPNDTIRFTITVPEGWQTVPEGWLGAGPGIMPATGSWAPAGTGMSFLKVDGLYSDPCNDNLGDPDIEVGPTVDDLVTALASQPMYEATTPTDVVVDGYGGVRMDLLLPAGIDLSSCEGGRYWVWDRGPYAQGPGNRWHLWILDIDGFRAVVLAEDFEGTSAEDRAELQAIVDSIQIDVR